MAAIDYDAGNPKHVQAFKRLEQLGELGNDEAWREVIATEAGRRVLYLIAADCGWRGSVWDPSSARQSDFNAGKQQAAFNLMGRFAQLSGPHFLAALEEATKARHRGRDASRRVPHARARRTGRTGERRWLISLQRGRGWSGGER
jgi:hypothetical protein